MGFALDSLAGNLWAPPSLEKLQVIPPRTCGTWPDERQAPRISQHLRSPRIPLAFTSFKSRLQVGYFISLGQVQTGYLCQFQLNTPQLVLLFSQFTLCQKSGLLQRLSLFLSNLNGLAFFLVMALETSFNAFPWSTSSVSSFILSPRM